MTLLEKSDGEFITYVKKFRRRTLIAQLGEAVIWILMILIALYEILPIMWMFSTSLRLPGKSLDLPPSFLPTAWDWTAYWKVLTTPLGNFPLFFINSVKIAVVTTLGVLWTCSTAGFAFARLRYRGRDFLFFLFLASMMVPYQVYVIPVFIIIRHLGLIDSHWAIILPAMTSGLGVFLMRQYFLTLPGELIDCAKIDGAGFFRIYWQILLPLIGPALSALAIETFLSQWNNFFGPLLFLRSGNKLTLPLALVLLQGYLGSGDRQVLLAGIMLSNAPVLVFFLLAQRYVVRGIALTGLKQ